MFRSTSAQASITRSPVGWLHIVSIAALLASLLSALSLRTAGAEAGPVLTFENYTLGTLNGQDGWSSTGSAGAGGPGYDHAIATQSTYPSMGSQVLRISNAVTQGSFGDQTFSKSLANDAGESSAENGGISGGDRQRFFSADFDFASADPVNHQPGLNLSISPDRGDGARMSWVQIIDEAAGLTLNFGDYQTAQTNFIYTPLATGLDRSAVHHLRITMEFVDGPDNDIVQVFLNGTLMHTGTSWEGYFNNVEVKPTRTVDSLLFRTAGTAAPATSGKGFFFDNLRLTSSDVPTSGSATVKVSGDNSWNFQTDGTAAVSTVSGPATPPLGTGSAQMLTGSDGNSAGRLRTTSLDGVLLSDLSALSYDTYISAFQGCQAPYLLIEVDLDGNTTADDYLFFEPCYQTGTYGGDAVPAQGAPVLNTWQTWDALSGGWWANNDGFGGPPLKTLTTYITANPTARVATSALGGVRLQVGRGAPIWDNNVSNVDNVILGVDGASTTYDFEPFVDTGGPATSDVVVSVIRSVAPGTIVLVATITDADSALASATYTMNGGSPQPIYAVDGAFDETEEQVRAVIMRVPAGTHTLCVRGTDTSGNVGEEACATATINAPAPPPPPPPTDTQAPLVSNVQSDMNPVRNNQQTLITAVISDTTTGGSNIASAQYQINGGSWSSMSASDGAFNAPTETVKKSLSFAQGGTYDICVRGKDAANRTSASSCMTLTVFEREDGSVVASGQFTSPKKAIVPTPNHTGKATFSLSAAYSDGSWTPSGSFSLTLSGSPVRFQSTALEWLVIDGRSGKVQGVGELNGRAGYTFEVSFQDNGRGTTDRIRIRIWNTNGGALVYDSQPGKSATAAPTIRLTSGNITIQQ